MSPRLDVSEERKAQILDAAQTIFSRKGFDAARMDDIAEQTGLSKGALYLYFKSKEELIIAILDRLFQREFQMLTGADLSTDSATAAIQKLTATLTEDINGLLRLIPIVYNFLALTFRNKYVQRTLRHYMNRYIDVFIPLIQRGIDSGEFRPVVAREVAIALSAIIEGTILLWVYNPQAIDPVLHIQTGINLLLQGVQAPP